MLGIEDYGSDVESGDESLKPTSKTVESPPASTSSLLSKLLPPASKSSFVLPPPKSSSPSLSAPSNSTSGASKASGTAAPKQKRTKKIAINLPSLPPADDADSPPAKKPRITSSGGTAGAGMSSLLSVLPAPKRPVPVIENKQERVLGGGVGPGLVFRTSKTNSEARHHDTADGPSTDRSHGGEADVDADGPVDLPAPSTSFLPPSLKKGRTNVSLENEGSSSRPPSLSQKSVAPPVDFFSLGTNTPPARPALASSAPTVTSTPSTSAPVPSSFSVSSAPAISTFRPPSPTLDDPYPGYYQLPSGSHVPYNAEYYASYARKWQAEYDKHIRALEKSQYDPETDGAQDVDMAAEMEKSRQEIKEREDRKALTAGNAGKNEDGEPAKPKMNVKGAKLGAVARSRHQLTTLLTEAYSNREVLEEKIAQSRRNRKEAGNKYGF